MTLGVMVVTPFGIVLSSDSLVSSTVDQTEIINPSKMVQMNQQEMQSLWPDLVRGGVSPPYLLDERSLRHRKKIITTSSDVKKIFQVADFPIGLAFAGEASIQYASIRGGLGGFVEAPIETFVSTIVKDVIKSRFSKENYDVFDIGECLSLALSTGFIAKENNDGVTFEIVGGGFSSDNVFPQSFKFSLDKWNTTGLRATILDAASYYLGRALLHALPIRASSRNWFEDFLKNDLSDCVELALCNTWWHSLNAKHEREYIENRIIPDVSLLISSSIGILGSILSEHPMRYLNQDRVSLSDVIARMWDLRKKKYESKWNDVVSEVISNCGIGDRVCQIWGEGGSQGMSAVNALQDSILSDLRDRTYDLTTGGEDSFHSRLPEGVREVLSEEAYNTLYFLISEYLKPTLLADMFLDLNPDSRSQNFRVTHNNGFYGVGQQETVDRIMWGLDLETGRQIREEVKRFQMHNVKRMGEIILHRSNNLQLNDPASFNFYHNNKQLGTSSFSVDSLGGDEDADSEQTDLNSFTDLNRAMEADSPTEGGDVLKDGGEQEGREFVEEKIVIPPGSSEWRGLISSSEGERYRCNVEFNISEQGTENDEDAVVLTFEGFIDIPDARDIMLHGEGGIINGDWVFHSLTFDYASDSEEVQANLQSSEYGIELTFSEQDLKDSSKRSSWKSMVLSPKEFDFAITTDEEQAKNHPLINSDFIVESTSLFYSELQEFEMPYGSSKWNVDYSQMPLPRAVSLAEYMIDSTIKKQIFNAEIPTVGGDILTATISFEDGFNFLEKA